MFWKWINAEDGNLYTSWGRPRSVNSKYVLELKPDFDVPIYKGEKIKNGDRVVYSMQGDASLGMGDSIWLINYLRDFYNIIGKRKIEFHICSSTWINKFYSNFLPSTFIFREEYIKKEEFDMFDHKIPGLYYWKDFVDQANRSWVDNKSILEHLYDNVGLEYKGLSNWSDFTNESVLFPNNSFYEKLNIKKNDEYIFFQWHSSGEAKNLPVKTNIKIIKFLLEEFPNHKIYIIGRMKGLDGLEKINKNIKNLSNKTSGLDVFSLAANSNLIISPDSAGIHLAEAYKIPAVGIFSVLPPVYVAKKYQIPTYMFGSGFCPHKPCGYVEKLPKNKCPDPSKNYCQVLQDVDLELLKKCIYKSMQNRDEWGIKKDKVNFYKSINLPIVL